MEPGVARTQAMGLSPEMGNSCGQQDNPHGRMEENADGFQWPEGSSPEGVRASSQDTTGV
jgi:hypothetical protein